MTHPGNALELLAARHFPSFLARCFNTVDPGSRFFGNWHIDLMAEYLEAVRRGEIRRLIVNVPPRSLKSLTISVAYPAWRLGHDPALRVVVASYAHELARRHSLDTRAVMKSDWYRSLFPATRIRRGRDRAQRFSTTANGFRFATSVGGTLTGEGRFDPLWVLLLAAAAVGVGRRRRLV